MTETTSHKAGEMIAQEEPWQCTLKMESAVDHCYLCLKRLYVCLDSAGVLVGTQMRNNRCSGCRFAKYCSVECQKNDWKDAHKLICPAIKRIVSDGDFPCEYNLLLLKVVAKFVQSPTSVTALLQLTSPRFALWVEDIQRRRQGVKGMPGRQFILDFLQLADEKKANLGESVYLDFAARVKHFAVPISGPHLTRIGLGIYLRASSIEHSCAPNACLTFVGKRLRVMALRNVENIDQVRISYLDVLHPLAGRRKLLKEFHVECRCVMCVDPTKDAERFCMPCVNRNCDAEIPSDQRVNLPCSLCGAKPTSNRLMEFGKVYEQVYELLEIAEQTGKVDEFGRLQAKMTLVFHPNNPLWPAFHVRAAFASTMSGFCEEARKALDLYRAFLSPVNPRTAYCAFWASHPDAPDRLTNLALLEEASRVMNMMLGEDHPTARTATYGYNEQLRFIQSMQ